MLKILAIFPILQCIFVAYSIDNTLHLLLPYSCIAPPHIPLPTSNQQFLLCICDRLFVYFFNVVKMDIKIMNGE